MTDEQEADSPRPRGRPKKEPEAKEERVWVKCVCENKPWVDDHPLHYWQDYKIPAEIADILSERKQVVILKQPEGD